jgi:MFS family permease
MELAALLWLVNEMTHSPLMLTIVGTCRYLPLVFFPILGGVVADRMDRRSLLLCALLTASMLSIILAVLVKTGLVRVWHILILCLMQGLCTSFNHPARQSIIPNLVKKEHLLNAVSLDSASVQASRFIATPITGLLIAAFGVVPVFGVRAVGCLSAMLWLRGVKINLRPPQGARGAGFRNVLDGLKYVRQSTFLLTLVPLYLIPWITQNSSNDFLPIFARDILKIGPKGYGLLQAAPGLGALLSLFTLAAVPRRRVNAHLLFMTSGVLSLFLFLFAVSVWPVFSLLFLLIVGAMTTAFMTINTALIQDYVSDVMRGRVMSLREVANGAGPAASLIFGYIAQKSSVPLSLALLAGCCLTCSLWLAVRFSRPRFRHMMESGS